MALDEIKLLSHVIFTFGDFCLKNPIGIERLYGIGENLVDLIKRHQSKGFLCCSSSISVTRLHVSLHVIHTALMLKIVLTCIAVVESIVSTELIASAATASTPRTRLPLPSPTSSFSNSPMLGQWTFVSSKIVGEDHKLGNIFDFRGHGSADDGAHSSYLPVECSGSADEPDATGYAPSILSQIVPNASHPNDDVDVALGSAISIARGSHEDSPVLYEALTEKITVKIVDRETLRGSSINLSMISRRVSTGG
ncbi:hypothetical protein CPB84DRAFT_1851649 [Gymnopilus junonius]|uniref:Uncharacterized protein n=1 Tax=Gymnopilus junonius TaxID=109634 RepID=A0A9P5NES2_GYMJU|nr:hypothetical protein CPB84DRAFT_1851649 [Gymnopilus junonius]